MAQQTSEVQIVRSDTQPERGLTVRAVMLALITLAGMCIFATYYGRNLMKSFLPITALMPLVVWIGINTVLKLTVPRLALTRTEVVSIFGVVWLVGTVPAIGWVGYLIRIGT